MSIRQFRISLIRLIAGSDIVCLINAQHIGYEYRAYEDKKYPVFKHVPGRFKELAEFKKECVGVSL